MEKEKVSANNVVVRRTTKEDVDQVIAMIQELAEFEAMPDGPELKSADLIRDGNLNGTSEPPIFFSFVAELNDDQNRSKLVGYTISFFSYSTWQGKSYFLEDLYVKPEFRGSGVGNNLFKENVRFALEENCRRFDFHVLDWNPAKKFYEALGAKNLSEKEGWEFFRMTKSEMEILVANKQ